MLLKARVAKSSRTTDMKHQILLPAIMLNSVIAFYHNSPLAGHSGIRDIFDRPREHVFCPGPANHVTQYTRHCFECQKRKITKVHTKSTMTSFTTPHLRFRKLTFIDLSHFRTKAVDKF